MKSTPHNWAELNDEDLLEWRICDLKLKIKDTNLNPKIEQLYDELNQKGIAFQPQCYLADEWFVPEGDTCIGIPFYLADPRLKKMEDKMMLEVEGGTKAEFLKLIRHETGHALFYSYRLHRKRGFKKIFGTSSRDSTENYRPKPYSKSYVRHLDNWYAHVLSHFF